MPLSCWRVHCATSVAVHVTKHAGPAPGVGGDDVSAVVQRLRRGLSQTGGHIRHRQTRVQPQRGVPVAPGMRAVPAVRRQAFTRREGDPPHFAQAGEGTRPPLRALRSRHSPGTGRLGDWWGAGWRNRQALPNCPMWLLSTKSRMGRDMRPAPDRAAALPNAMAAGASARRLRGVGVTTSLRGWPNRADRPGRLGSQNSGGTEETRWSTPSPSMVVGSLARLRGSSARRDCQKDLRPTSPSPKQMPHGTRQGGCWRMACRS